MTFAATGLVDSGDPITCETTNWATYPIRVSIGRLSAEMTVVDLIRLRAAINQCLAENPTLGNPHLIETAPTVTITAVPGRES